MRRDKQRKLIMRSQLIRKKTKRERCPGSACVKEGAWSTLQNAPQRSHQTRVKKCLWELAMWKSLGTSTRWFWGKRVSQDLYKEKTERRWKQETALAEFYCKI